MTFQYSRTLGYRRGPDGRPEIDPDEAETLRLIYTRYLEGRNLGDIQRELVKKNIPTAAGIQGWSRQVIQNILTSEKYIGDGLRQKTYTTGPIGNKKTVKNNGELPMYYSRDHHPAIIPRDIYYRLKEELAQSGGEGGGMSLLELRQRLDALTVEQAALADKILEVKDDSELNAQLETVTAEKQSVLDQIAACQQDEGQRTAQASRQREMEAWLDRQPMCFTEYDDALTRRFVERITVVDAETIQVKIRNADAGIDGKLC